MVDRPLPPEVAERLGPFYVYALVDPRDGSTFYIGKGTGQRLLAHGFEADIEGDDRRNRAKLTRIRSIRAAGFEPRLDIVRHGLTEPESFLVEAALIDSLDGLTNAVAGHGTSVGRRSLHEYATAYGAEPVPEDAPPAVLIRLSRWTDMPEEMEPGITRAGNGYRSDMTAEELVDATRAWWKISRATVEQRGCEHAVAVHEGVTRAVMRVGSWVQRADGRRCFAAEPVREGPVFDAWIGPFGRRVDFASNSQNPITYWPIRS